MNIEQQQGTRVLVALHTAMGHQCATPFLQRNGQFEILHIDQRKTAQNRVAVMPLLQSNIGLISAMRQLECIAQHIDLTMMMGPWDVLVHFLHQHDIRSAMLNRLDHPVEPIESIDAADSFVNVVRDQPELHERLGPQGTCRQSPQVASQSGGETSNQ